MARFVAALLLFGIGLPCAAAGDEAVGQLKIEKKSSSGKSQIVEIPYNPHEGDLVFYDDRHPFWTVMFLLAGSGPPLHMGIVVKQNDGSFGILEAGPDDTIRVALIDLEKRLKQFDEDFHGTITIRRCKKALTREQSATLTKFAHAQDGKRYAIGRILLEGTCLHVRGPLRELIFGKTYLDRDAWMCAELAVAAAANVKLIDPNSIAANATYPADIVDNRRHDLSRGWHDAAVWTPRK